MPSAVCRPALRRLLLVPLLLQYVCLLLSGGLLRCVLLLLLLQVARLWALGTHRRRMLLAAALPAGKQHVEGAARAEGQSTGRLAARQAAPTRCKRPLVNTVPLSCNAPLRPAATRFLPLPAPGHVCHGRLAAAAVAAAGKHPAAQAADVRVVVQEDALGAVLVAHVRLAAADTVEHVSEYLFELALQTTRQREGVGRWQGWLLRRPPSGPCRRGGARRPPSTPPLLAPAHLPRADVVFVLLQAGPEGVVLGVAEEGGGGGRHGVAADWTGHQEAAHVVGGPV